MENLSSDSGNKTSASTFATLIQLGTASSSHSNQAKEMRHFKQKSKIVSVYRWYALIYRKTHKAWTPRHLKLINKYSKGVGCKINIQKLIFLYNNKYLKNT